MRGNIRTFPNFHICFLISVNSNSFHHETLERRWHDFFHLFKWQGVLKIFEFHLRIFPILKLYATQWFSREKIKWLLKTYEIWVRSFKGLNSKSHWNYYFRLMPVSRGMRPPTSTLPTRWRRIAQPVSMCSECLSTTINWIKW